MTQRLPDFAGSVAAAIPLPADLAQRASELTLQTAAFNRNFAALCQVGAARESLADEIGILEQASAFLGAVVTGPLSAAKASTAEAVTTARAAVRKAVRFAASGSLSPQDVADGFSESDFVRFIDSHASVAAAKKAAQAVVDFTADGMQAEVERLIRKRSGQLANIGNARSSAMISI